MTTPFDTDGRIDFDQLQADARRLAAAGVDGLVPMGSTGESATVSHEEHIDVVEAVVEAADSIPVIAGAGSNNTDEAIKLARRSAAVGADALLLIAPYYNRPEQRGFQTHYRTIADTVDLPQIVYNVPSRTGENIDPSTVIELANHANIQGYKAASGDLGQVSQIIEQTREMDFAVLSGDDALTLPIISMGGTGTISVAANIEPERTTAMVDAAVTGDVQQAQALHHQLGPLFRALFTETNPIPVKEAMALRDYGPARLRSPLTRATETTREQLAAVLEQVDNHNLPAER